MHPSISNAVSTAHSDDLRRFAADARAAGHEHHARFASVRRYFGHARQADQHHLVGRVGELAELELASREAAAGRPVLVLLGGESGVGKTRLVGEFEQRLVGTVVLRGEGVEQGDAELPYAPLLGALRPLVRERHPALEALSAGSRSALAALLPALGNGESPGEGDQGEQLRLFEALLELLELLSDSAPVVLILEDMHWADRSTRTFAAFLARTLRRSA